ncbi:MAG: DUF4240 domain-containing protein [Gemmatimonadales bacterium]
MMTRDQFWTVIDSARRLDPDEPAEGLRKVLGRLKLAEIAGFQAHFDELFDAACRWDLWGAAYLMGGGCSDDGFIDFRYGLISHGRRVYEAALADPDSLAGLDDHVEDEAYGSIAAEVHEDKGGGALPPATGAVTEPAGEQWDFDDPDENRKRLPRLSEEYGAGC